MMSLRTLLAISALVAFVASADSGAAQKYFDLLSVATTSGKAENIAKYFSNDFKIVFPNSNKSVNKDSFVKTLLKREFSRNTLAKVDPATVVEENGQISGEAILKGETLYFPISFVLKKDAGNNAGYSLQSINGPETLIF